MAGYLTPFQSWIYEHFPGMGRRRLVTSYDDTTPRAMRGIGAFGHSSASI
ncbi:hypothetical protein LR48_Vigan03g122100 [Vigna angularis]|uniref:Uncharacterized protein n=1 Tax=Phaseolus angularis TaxID=3914 RepID=A0A0L9U5Y9_PHAAN|nr:hypothetical protein LR48_Vigan03g122100 [Vigna angularis]